MQFTAEQERAITSDAPRLCVDAGAGSGKTRVLIERIVHLVEQRGVPLEQIAAITFTEKAAAEMKARLRAAFRARALAAEDDPPALTRWRALEQRVEAARISTIHAFCAGLLREFALPIGLDPDFTVLGDADGALLRSETVRSTVIALLEASDPNVLRLTADHGVAALRDVLDKMLRTQPAVRQAAAQQPLEDPGALYAAWDGVLAKERVRALREVARSRAVRSLVTQLERFEGQCTKAEDGREVLRVHMLLHLRALSEGSDDLQQPVSHIEMHLDALQEKVGTARKANWPSDTVFDALKAVQDQVKKFAAKAGQWPSLDPAFDHEATEICCALYAVFAKTAAAWEAAKRVRNVLDFDGMIQETLAVLRDNAPVRARAANALRHLLMDEFQDTDHTQLEIALRLHEEPGGPDFFFVGDPKQSIYNFRGAEVEIFGEQRARAVEQVALRDNFRTLAGVMAYINAIFGDTGLLQSVGDYPAMRPGRGTAMPDPVGARVELLRVAAEDDTGVKRKVDALRRCEATMIAARIAQLCADDAPPTIYDDVGGVWRRARYGDIALLFRSMSSLYIYEEALRDAGIDFIATAGSGFHRRQEVLDVVNALRVLVAPRDVAALAAFLRGPLGRMSDEGLFVLAKQGGLVQAFAGDAVPEDLGAADASALRDARALIAALHTRRHRPADEVIAFLLEQSGLEATVLDHHYGLQKASNLRKLRALAQDFSARSHAPLDRFVRYLADVAGHDVLREGEALMQPYGGGAVTLMSIHKSKGLEFPIVFVCDMGQKQDGDRESRLFLHRELGFVLSGASPSGEPKKPALAEVIAARAMAKNEAEGARLLYVAMTRARDLLVLCGTEKPGKRSWYEALDHWQAFLPGRHGDVLRGKGWAAQIVAQEEIAPNVARTHAVAPKREAVQAVVDALAARAPLATTPQAISVSALLDRMGAQPDDEDERQTPGLHNADESAPTPPAPQNDGALLRGSAVHRLFECWDFHSDRVPVDAALFGAQLAPDEREALRVDLLRVAETFTATPLHATLRDAARLRRELPFALRLDAVIINGTIDLLVDDDLLIDYKTGRPAPEKQQRYALQARLYATALRAITGHAPARAVIAFVDHDEQVEVALAPEDLDATLVLARRALGLGA